MTGKCFVTECWTGIFLLNVSSADFIISFKKSSLFMEDLSMIDISQFKHNRLKKEETIMIDVLNMKEWATSFYF